MGEILGSKVPSRYIQHRVNSRRGIAGLSCIVFFQILDSTHSHKSAKKVQDIMKRIVIGLMENTAITVETLLIFIHGLTTETLPLLQDKK